MRSLSSLNSHSSRVPFKKHSAVTGTGEGGREADLESYNVLSHTRTIGCFYFHPSCSQNRLISTTGPFAQILKMTKSGSILFISGRASAVLRINRLWQIFGHAVTGKFSGTLRRLARWLMYNEKKGHFPVTCTREFTLRWRTGSWTWMKYHGSR